MNKKISINIERLDIQIPMDNIIEDINLLLLYSFRYCLGRMTYSIQDFYDMTEKYLPIITRFSKKIMIKEIKEYKQKYISIGHQCDDEIWMKILKILQKKRGEL